jgi:hypothetical protein
MLRFASASNGIVDSTRAAETALLSAKGSEDLAACRLVVFHVTMGHDHRALLDAVRRLCPTARIVGCTCAGVIGREGADESPRALALMLAWGDAEDLAIATTRHMVGANSGAESAQLARELCAARGKPQFVMLLASGIDIDAQSAIDGIESELGPEVTIFGGTSADNMQGIASYQFLDGDIHERAAALIGFFDPSLAVHTRASHGFVPAAVQLKVTKAEGNRVHELDGEPAWNAYTRGLGLKPDAVPGDTIPPGALGVELSREDADDYGDSHLLRVITKKFDDGTMLMPVRCQTGERLSLMRRDEERIFRNLDDMMRRFRAELAGRRIVGVFHADCGARGRLTLNRVAKDEIVRAMQTPLWQGSECPPWLGMYGFGEFARLAGKNCFHNYTTALYVISRR